jgi:hypothetical protein
MPEDKARRNSKEKECKLMAQSTSPVLAKVSSDLKGISKKRLRVRGKRVESTEQVKQWIYEIIVASPRTPTQLQQETGFSAMHVWRYAKQLLKEDKIEKDGHIYKKKGLADYQVRLEKVNQLTKQGFGQIPIVQSFIQYMKRPDLNVKAARNQYSLFRSICLGTVVPAFRCHPEDWQAHETTISFRDEYFKHKNVSRLSRHIRLTLRLFYQLCLKYPLTEMEALQIGIDGAKDAAQKGYDKAKEKGDKK